MWLWNLGRPVFEAALRLTHPRGLRRVVNQQDAVRIETRYRVIPETYEPELWNRVMGSVRPGDTFVDVGAYIGLYSVAVANRVGEAGTVIAFEPDFENRRALLRHTKLNAVQDRVQALPCAVGSFQGTVRFSADQSSESSVGEQGTTEVDQITLDDFFSRKRIDVLKIDVEGYETHVIQGCTRILSDPSLRPRHTFLEIHPYAWPKFDVSSTDLTAAVEACGLKLFSLDSDDEADLSDLGWAEARPAGRT